ncbi:MAG TPA: hypothetical protein VGI81_11185, partial [Tepidisphaeraceae bacterium]
ARIATGEWDRALVGAAEEFSPTVNDAHARCESSIARGAVIGSGAVTFLLESRASIDSRGGRARGRVTAGVSRMAQGAARLARASRDAAREIGASEASIESALVPGRLRLIAECFSVGPMAELAAALLTGRARNGAGLASGAPIGAVATDSVGIVAGIAIEPMGL